MLNVKSGFLWFVLILAVADGFNVPVYDEEAFTETKEPSSTDLAVTLDNITESSAAIEKFERRFQAFSERASDYVENLRREHMRLRSDIIDFARELDVYMDKLPKNETRTLEIIKYRSTCVCDGRRESPCPKRCIDSCYLDDKYDIDCTHSFGSNCYCYRGSPERCDFGLESCYDVNTKKEGTFSPPCIEYGMNQTIFDKSFKLFAHLLIEPLKKTYRDINFKLQTMENNLAALVMLTRTADRLCDERNRTSCFPAANDLLAEQLKRYSKAQKNITLYLISSQNVTQDVNRNIHDFKEKTISQINTAIKKYSCCLRALDFDVPNNECNDQPSLTSNPVIPTPKVPQRDRTRPMWPSNSLSLGDISD